MRATADIRSLVAYPSPGSVAFRVEAKLFNGVIALAEKKAGEGLNKFKSQRRDKSQ